MSYEVLRLGRRIAHSLPSGSLVDGRDEETERRATLHVLFHRPLPDLYPDLLEKSDDDLKPREALLDWLSSSSLGGDKDAAEWVLLSLLSFTYVHSRIGTVQGGLIIRTSESRATLRYTHCIWFCRTSQLRTQTLVCQLTLPCFIIYALSHQDTLIMH